MAVQIRIQQPKQGSHSGYVLRGWHRKRVISIVFKRFIGHLTASIQLRCIRRVKVCAINYGCFVGGTQICMREWRRRLCVLCVNECISALQSFSSLQVTPLHINFHTQWSVAKKWSFPLPRTTHTIPGIWPPPVGRTRILQQHTKTSSQTLYRLAKGCVAWKIKSVLFDMHF